MPRPKLGGGRVQRLLTVDNVFDCGARGFTKADAARWFGCHVDSITKAFADRPELQVAFDQGLADRMGQVRDLQMTHARRRDAGGVAMTIHMSKHLLGERDKVDVEHDHGGQINVLHALWASIDGTSRGLPCDDPPPLIYSPADKITVVPKSGNATASVTIVSESLGPGGTAPVSSPDATTPPVADDAPKAPKTNGHANGGNGFEMPPRAKSLLPDFDEE